MDMDPDGGVAEDALARLREICLALPDAYEEAAWVGRRWRVRDKTFAHVVTVVDGRPPAFAKVIGHDGPATVVTFRSAGEELQALCRAGHPFFRAGWGRDVVGMYLDDATDWGEVAELMTESFCVMAPTRLRDRVDRPAE
ncbi:MmcQ/YjbR family DNA-binding protein [Yinghuangia seranimata]|uniref:MmcQ/YjbR family DNA-binding protein n=1 Tax=Yinghuangia seranimata TaxID=408067 RepID=UPI00248C30DB|nr:MmcQ/YjbR family DNA-binding protein [Yinghuangia seranimata]MDI2130065.1 MmcQ/YjbR family DNA-binding protein [Yinghuangia seranimata]